MNMDVRPLLNDSDLDWALAEIEAYFVDQPAPETPEAARYNVLAALIENYEDKRWPIDPLASVRSPCPAWRYKADGAALVPRRKMTSHRAG